MQVLVTGGGGEVGVTVVDRLKRDHAVAVADIGAPPPNAGSDQVEWTTCDLTDLDAARRVVAGQDAVVHLAAIPNSFTIAGPEIVRVNMVSAYNVAEACREAGVRRVVYASSDSATGFGIRNVNYRPDYLPIDDKHICRPHESYSLTKYFGERIFEEYARAYRIPTVSVRLLYVLLDKRCRDEFGAMLKNRGDEAALDWMGGYVMPQDVAEIIARSLTCDVAAEDPEFPFAIFYAHAADTLNSLYTGKTTLEQAALIWGEVPPVANTAYYAQNPHAPFFDIAPLQEKLGYTPQFTYRDYAFYAED